MKKALLLLFATMLLTCNRNNEEHEELSVQRPAPAIAPPAMAPKEKVPALTLPPVPDSMAKARIIRATGTRLVPLVRRQGHELGDPIFIRIFKEERQLEVWLKREEKYTLFATYPIHTFSGGLGPKLSQGDEQAPEGFYFVGKNGLAPWSRYHLAINVGYPNYYDKAHGRTGGYIMIHGAKVSIGCFAMTDPLIEEIFTLAYYALARGQRFFRVHIFPFRMTPGNMTRHRRSRWFGFWKNVKEGYDWFEKKRREPKVSVTNRRYTFS